MKSVIYKFNNPASSRVASLYKSIANAVELDVAQKEVQAGFDSITKNTGEITVKDTWVRFVVVLCAIFDSTFSNNPETQLFNCNQFKGSRVIAGALWDMDVSRVKRGLEEYAKYELSRDGKSFTNKMADDVAQLLLHFARK